MEAVRSLESGDAHLAFMGHLASVSGWKMSGLASAKPLCRTTIKELSSQVFRMDSFR